MQVVLFALAKIFQLFILFTEKYLCMCIFFHFNCIEIVELEKKI